jgi:hypothetical protein
MDARVLLQAAYEVHVDQGGSRHFPAGSALDMAAAGRVGWSPERRPTTPRSIASNARGHRT